MKFVSIPSYGASWREPLIYSFSTETSEAMDVVVEILEASTQELLGQMRLYGVTKGMVNIAPYVARRASLAPINRASGLAVMQSPSAVAVVVRINGVYSEKRLFFRAAFSPDMSMSLSRAIGTQEVEKGDVIRLTLCPKGRLWITVSYSRRAGLQPKEAVIDGGAIPMELLLTTDDLKVGDVVTVNLQYDLGAVQSFRYTVHPRRVTSKRLLWYNPLGGVESYTFGHSIRIGYGVEVQSVEECVGEERRRVDGELRYRLCTGQESMKMLEHVAELLLSPVVYKCSGTQCEQVDVVSREVAYDRNGELHNMTLEVKELWKGGGLVW